MEQLEVLFLQSGSSQANENCYSLRIGVDTCSSAAVTPMWTIYSLWVGHVILSCVICDCKNILVL